MKKYLFLLLFPILFSCSNDDGISKNGEYVIKYFRSTAFGNDNFGYSYSLLVTVTAIGSQEVKGHVLFHTNEFGTLKSETKTLLSGEDRVTNSFSVRIKTEEKLESLSYYAEFILE